MLQLMSQTSRVAKYVLTRQGSMNIVNSYSTNNVVYYPEVASSGTQIYDLIVAVYSPIRSRLELYISVKSEVLSL